MFTGGVSQITIDLISSALTSKRRDLARLRQALRELRSNQTEFISSRTLTEEPELTPSTWHGKHANEFKDIRSNEVIPSYEDLYNKQLAQAISDIESAIARLEAEIRALEAKLASAKSS